MMPRKKIAIVEDDRLIRQQISLSLSKEYDVIEAGDRETGEQMIRDEKPDLCLLDLNLPPTGKSQEGMKLVQLVRDSLSDTVVIVMTGNPDLQLTLRAVESGVYDFFKKPFDLVELKLILRRALEKQEIQRENRRLQTELTRKYSFESMIGVSSGMQRVFESVKRVADTPTSVIIRGESGTGKELIARAIHYNSKRRDKPFISVNCAALPETLIEAELFGHEKGAFTGAITAHQGRFELAHEGTLFLDEIGSISHAVQAKLLRVLQERKFERIGGTRLLSSDVRLVTATNEDLEKNVSSGTFREDLYYRIHVFPIHLPPLRERIEDIPLLADHFLRIYCRENHIPLKHFHDDAFNALSAYQWKGNVRELENLVQTLVLMTDSETIQASDLPSYIRTNLSASPPRTMIPEKGINLEQTVENYESELIRSAIQRAKGVKARAAELLGIDKNKMKYLCRKYGI